MPQTEAAMYPERSTLPTCSRWIPVARGKPIACGRDAVGSCAEHGAVCIVHALSPMRARLCDRCAAPLSPLAEVKA